MSRRLSAHLYISMSKEMIKNRARYLFERYATNTCTRAELDEFLDCLQDDQQATVLHEFESRMDPPHHALSSRLTIEDVLKATRVREKSISLHKYYQVWAVAASVLLFAALSYVIGVKDPANLPTPLTKSAELTTKATQAERRLVVLPDGSSVQINKQTKLEYPTTFSANKREVYLEGEAFFDIQPDKTRPFIIHTGSITTTVLGTAFNIRAFPKEERFTVTVARGRVRVADTEKAFPELTAQQELSIDMVEKQVDEVEPTFVAKVAPAWLKEDLILDNVKFDAAAKVIEERYDVKVMFKNEALKNCSFTSTFLKDASLIQMLTAICIVNRATYRVENNSSVIIDGEGCNL